MSLGPYCHSSPGSCHYRGLTAVAGLPLLPSVFAISPMLHTHLSAQTGTTDTFVAAVWRALVSSHFGFKLLVEMKPMFLLTACETSQ